MGGKQRKGRKGSVEPLSVHIYMFNTKLGATIINFEEM